MAKSPSRRLRFGAFLVLALTAFPVPARAITMTFGDIEITPEPPPRGNSSHGYFEYVFHVHNKSAEQPHLVGLSIPFQNLLVNGDAIRDLRRSVQVGVNETVRISLLQPDHPPLHGSDVAVHIDGRRQEREVPLNLSNTRSHRSYAYPSAYSLREFGSGEPLILMGPRVRPLPTTERLLPGEPREAEMPGWAGMPPGMAGPPGMRPGQPPRVRPGGRRPPHLPPTKPGLPSRGIQFVNVDSWSDNWLAYSRYDGIVVTADELQFVSAEVRAALWQYVETGGALLVLGKIDLRGLSALTRTTQDSAGWTTLQAGFGVCRVSPDANYDSWDANHFSLLTRDWTNTVSAGHGQRGTSEANREFPVIDDLGIPVKGLFVLMFLFTLAIGPMNLLVLTRLKRRIWLLWTTPAISLFTCLAVFGYMLISEGWQGQLRSETLTLLDETTLRATTIGWTGVYSPLTPGDGLHFHAEAEVIPQRFYEGRKSGARSCTIDWSKDQHFVSGWVEARVPAHFKVRQSEMRRERVTLQRESDGRWSMVNKLGAAIHRFWYADDKGQIHVAEDVAAGAPAVLRLTEKECQVPARTMQSILSGSSWMSGMQQIANSPQHYLRPGLYLAEVDESPFLEAALRSAKKRKVHALIVGFGK